MARALLLAALAASLLAAAGGFALTRDSTPVAEAVPGPSSPYQMALDADADTPGVQASHTVTATGVFTVAVTVTQVSGAYDGYQWMVEYPSSGLNFLSREEITGGSGLTGCYPMSSGSGSNAQNVRISSACIGSPPTTYVGAMTELTFQCLSDGPHSLMLLDLAQGGPLGSTLTNSSTDLETGTASGIVTCASGAATPAPTYTPTAQPTSQPGSANVMAIDSNTTLRGFSLQAP